ncbi:MAG: Nif11-like leader peptide family RiPP precursor [Lachnospiraceae bacterium]|nr:Nif11-like leader peptide family RiPP precursor [Lachnospiraceae bacterium]
MKEFLEAIEENEELRAKVEELNRKADASPKDFSALAKEYGFDLREEDFSGVRRKMNEISEDELDAVAGGVIRQVKKCGGRVVSFLDS